MKLKGLGVSPGRIQAPIMWLRKAPPANGRETALSVPDFHHKAVQTLTHLADTASSPVLKDILRAQVLMVDDPMLWDAISAAMAHGATLIEAVRDSIANIAHQFDAIDDPYLAARADDVRDIGQHLLDLLMTSADTTPWPAEGPSILVSDTLFPSDTAKIDLSRVVGIVLGQGSLTSHVAILSRSLQIPAVIVENVQQWLHDGDPVMVDGSLGMVSDEEMSQEPVFIPRKTFTVQPDIVSTKDGVPIRIEANVGSVQDAVAAHELGADGIGLLRTEFLFAGDHFPSEQEQYEVLYSIAQAAPKGRPIIIRAVDIGGDKPLPYLNLPVEPNPFLGTRAARLLTQYPDLYDAQLRAVLRLSQDFPVQLMFPMIATLNDWTECQNLMLRAQSSLNLEHCPIPLGIMVEVPSVVFLATKFARLVNFFSIGTNDLIQYLFAADRSVTQLSRYYRPDDEAVAGAIRMTVAAAEKAHIPIGMCGEMAGDVSHTPLLVGLGLREFSVSPHLVPVLKSRVSELSVTECEAEYHKLILGAQFAEQTLHGSGPFKS